MMCVSVVWAFFPRSNPANNELTCEICGGHMVEQKCKIRCLNCGFTRDCSDP